MDFTSLAQRMQGFFGKAAESVARSKQFVQRASKVNGKLFLKTLVFGLLNRPDASWEELAAVAQQICPRVRITAQGLHARANEQAQAYLQAMVQKSVCELKHRQPMVMQIFERFSEVNIRDSSQIALPEGMRKDFRGPGGTANRAAMKVQLVYQFLTGAYHTLALTPAVHPDQKYAVEQWDHIEAGSLNLDDLGYFSLGYLKAIEQKQAYFCSRLQSQTGVFERTNGACGAPLDLVDLLGKAPKRAFEIAACIGAQMDKQVSSRIVFIPLDASTVNRRRRRARRQAQQKGRTPSRRHLAWLEWAVFTTNAPRERFATAEVALVYGLRWQIELLFKLWKSHYQVDERRAEKPETVLIRLYAKLIGLILFNLMCAPIRPWTLAKTARELSFTKALKMVRMPGLALAQNVGRMKRLVGILKDLVRLIGQHGLKQKRVTHKSTYQLLEQAVAGVRRCRVLEKPSEYLRKVRKNFADHRRLKFFRTVPVAGVSEGLA